MIAWWCGALRGATIRKLHNDWRAGMTLAGAVTAGPRMGLLGIACIFSTLVAIDGPLLQKATHVEYDPIENWPHDLNVSVLPELPRFLFSGYVYENQSGANGWHPSLLFNCTIPTANHGSFPNNALPITLDWIAAVKGPWLRKEAMTGAVRGCPSGKECRLKIRAPALTATACTSYQVPFDYRQIASYQSVDAYNHASPMNTNSFLIDVSLNIVGEKEKINVVTGTAQTTDCAGTLNYTACTLERAIADYEMMAHDDQLTFLDAGSPNIVALSNNSHVVRQWNSYFDFYNSSLAGIVTILVNKWESQASYFRNSYNESMYLTSFGSPADTYEKVGRYITNHGGCANYFDPREDLLEDMNKLMFYTAYMAGARTDGDVKEYFLSQLEPGMDANPVVRGYVHGHHTVYVTNLRWFGAAAAIEALCIALVLPTFIGWWRLGRPVSFSPVEIAKAFEAPLLSDCNSNSSGRDIAKRVGDLRIQYGATMDENIKQTRLAFANPEEVQRPMQESFMDM